MKKNKKQRKLSVRFLALVFAIVFIFANILSMRVTTYATDEEQATTENTESENKEDTEQATEEDTESENKDDTEQTDTESTETEENDSSEIDPGDNESEDSNKIETIFYDPSEILTFDHDVIDNIGDYYLVQGDIPEFVDEYTKYLGNSTKYVGDEGGKGTGHPMHAYCPNCKESITDYIWARCYLVPKEENYKLSDPSILKDCKLVLRMYEQAAKPILSFIFTAAKPGITTLTLEYYYNFNYGTTVGVCNNCNKKLNARKFQKWYKVIKTYTITVIGDYALIYDANGGENAPETQKVVGTTDDSCTFIVSNQEPTREGYIFKGWAENPEASNPDYHAGNEITLNDVREKTIYAVWEENKSEEPSNPDTPEQPSDPSGPNNPVQPSDPSEPNNPVQPSDPSKPDTPNQPIEPSEPDNPIVPNNSKIERPAIPYVPIPDTSEVSDNPKEKIEIHKEIEKDTDTKRTIPKTGIVEIKFYYAVFIGLISIVMIVAVSIVAKKRQRSKEL